MTINAEKQLVFIRRILYTHELAVRRGGKSSTLKVNLTDWHNELDRMSVLAHILNKMFEARDEDGEVLFPMAMMHTVAERAIEGDYHDEADSLLGCMDPLFKVEATAIYNEFLPDRPSKNIAQVESADTKLDSLALDAKRAQYESDQLSLARDIAQIGNLIRALSKSDHARRTERILHIRNQNVIGASLVSTWMASSCSVMSGSVKDQAAAIERALAQNPSATVLVWCDFMKMGRLSKTDIQDTTELIQLALKKRPTSSVAFVISPFLTSEKVTSGHRGESLSDVQEAAQILGGEQFPRVLISTLLDKSDIKNDETLLCINLTPYDAWLEKTLSKWSTYGLTHKFKSVSLTKPYEATPPTPSCDVSCDPTKFPLKLVQVDYEYDTAMNTWKNLRFRLFGNQTMDDAEHMKALVVGESEEPETPIAPMEPWKGEPATIDALLDTHILENKVA
ncbi:unnamed protein product, partial [Durusdinium trenchii]